MFSYRWVEQTKIIWRQSNATSPRPHPLLDVTCVLRTQKVFMGHVVSIKRIDGSTICTQGAHRRCTDTMHGNEERLVAELPHHKHRSSHSRRVAVTLYRRCPRRSFSRSMDPDFLIGTCGEARVHRATLEPEDFGDPASHVG